MEAERIERIWHWYDLGDDVLIRFGNRPTRDQVEGAAAALGLLPYELRVAVRLAVMVDRDALAFVVGENPDLRWSHLRLIACAAKAPDDVARYAGLVGPGVGHRRFLKVLTEATKADKNAQA